MSMPEAGPRPVALPEGLRALAHDYDAVLCDVWGVIHNGVSAWPEARAALAALRAAGGVAILVSNAPRPAGAVVPQLDALDVPRGAYDALVTSGDVTRDLLAARPGLKVQHLGPPRDTPLFEGLDLVLAGPEAADIVVATGLDDDDRETPEDYRAPLGRLAARAVPMICANPDIVVERGDRLVWCAGALAELYETLGGAVTLAGKPHPPIYQAALSRCAEIAGRAVPAGRVLAIGDSLRTDVAGAAGMGFDALFIAGGIHSGEVGDGPLDAARLERLFADAGVRPRAAMATLAW